MCRVTAVANIELLLNRPFPAANWCWTDVHVTCWHQRCAIEEFSGNFRVMCGVLYKLSALFLRITCFFSPAPTSASTCGFRGHSRLLLLFVFSLLLKTTQSCSTSKQHADTFAVQWNIYRRFPLYFCRTFWKSRSTSHSLQLTWEGCAARFSSVQDDPTLNFKLTAFWKCMNHFPKVIRFI